MNFYAVINGINSICALAIAIIAFCTRSRKPAQIAFGLFCLVLFAFTFTYFMWGIQTTLPPSIFWFRLLTCAICFIHTTYFHFSLAFTRKATSNKSVIAGYFIAVACLFIAMNDGLYDLSAVREKPPFYFWPHASSLTIIFIAIQIFYVLWAFYIQIKSIKNMDKILRPRLIYFFVTGILAWSGGLMNWFYWYDAIPIPPVGNVVITVYMVITAYLIFKHDILELNLVVKRTFVYALLTLFITATYVLFIVIFERLFQTVVGYRSFIATIFASLTIAVFFNPLRSLLNRFIEKIFFGKGIFELSTENLLMKKELQKQDRLKAVATLAAGMAHEIKNPLTSIKTFAEYLPQKYDDPNFRDKFKKIISEEVDRINRIVQQLLDFSRQKELDLGPAEITGILDDTLDFLNNDFLGKKIEIVRDYAAKDALTVDRNELKQAFLNIFLNSIQAMPEGGVITVKTFKESVYFNIQITDTGLGISKEHLNHVFDPFFTTKESGTGLGLAIVYRIVTKHGGTIHVKSQKGFGTTLHILLPIAERES